MTMNNAKTFLREIIKNTELRNSLNKAPTRKDVKNIIKNAFYEFDSFEIDDAYRNLLLHCQSEEQAHLIKEIKQWWDLLLFMTPEDQTETHS